MNPRSLLDYLTGTQRASWSDRGFHTRNLAGHGLTAEKVYLLGYAAATPASVERLAQCVHRRSARCLRRVFDNLPWEEDELGPLPSDPMCAVYLLVHPGQPPQLLVLEAVPSSPVLLHVAATGFPYHLLWGKTLVSEPT
ncbi:hypothetical protein I2I05_11800 [Hymenobacter sp. BT683]|uniref:Uncharacterized protein n=1 Tax=Hymenobacter jeongseonensis TaxID=2791027 RepID=A0ABS0II92_9BACT|nr:hypothetical protein [Hymenobacter jeongseonensis]MBF9238079.1 hypothetical protein [Hymenobacter jeongseonensis]